MKLALLWVLALALASCNGTREKPSAFGEPLYVNGKRIEDDEIKLVLIQGPGRLVLDMRKTGLQIELEIRRQCAEKAEAEISAREKLTPFVSDAAREAARKSALERIAPIVRESYRISDAEFEAEYRRNAEEFGQRYPTLKLETEACRAFRSVPWYRAQLRQTMLFDRVCLPDNPADWPTTTVDAIRADPAGGGQLLFPDAEESYRQRLADKAGGKPEREDPLYLTFLREIVRDAAWSKVKFKTPADGIPPGLALWADANGDGKPELEITIEELWHEVQPALTAQDIDDAKRWLVTSRATRDRLATDGALLTPEEGRAALARFEEDPDGGYGSFEERALQSYCFPSAESFAEYLVLRAGYQRTIESTLAAGPDGGLSPALREHFDRANRVMGLGMVDAEVLLVSALDLDGFRWKKNGWDWAWKQANFLRCEYDQDPTPAHWARLLDEHSEYRDPPAPQPVNGKYQTDCAERNNKGRFGLRYRNDLVNFVGESRYTEWVTGECITDRVFHDQPVNTVAGPFRGPLGWYLTRLNKRTPPARPLKLSNEQHLQSLKDDYLRSAFIQYSKEAVAKADIRGWRPL